MKKFFLFTLSLIATSAYPAKLILLKEKIMLGKTPITILNYTANQPGDTYFHPHNNETTALKAAKIMVKRYGGKIISLSYGNQRLIYFYLHKKNYVVDPNRIFTNKGIRSSLKKYGPYSTEAFQAVKNLSQHIINLLPGKSIIAIHNNKTKTYSELAYQKGHHLYRDAKKIFTNPDKSKRNFIYVTDNRLYEKLLPYKFNLVLQDKKRVINDGSLSVYAAYHKIPYVNVEAAYGDLNQQLAMLKAVHQVLQN